MSEFVQELFVHSWKPPDTFACLSLCWDALLLSCEEEVLWYFFLNSTYAKS